MPIHSVGQSSAEPRVQLRGVLLLELLRRETLPTDL